MYLSNYLSIYVQNTRKTHTKNKHRDGWHRWSKTTIQQSKHPQNTHETRSRTKKDMRKMITRSQRVC